MPAHSAVIPKMGVLRCRQSGKRKLSKREDAGPSSPCLSGWALSFSGSLSLDRPPFSIQHTRLSLSHL